MKTLKIKVCYDTNRNPSVVVNRLPNGVCYSDGTIEIPERFEIAETEAGELLIGVDNNYYPFEDLIFVSAKTNMVYLRTPWDDNNTLDCIPLKTIICDDTRFC